MFTSTTIPQLAMGAGGQDSTWCAADTDSAYGVSENFTYTTATCIAGDTAWVNPAPESMAWH